MLPYHPDWSRVSTSTGYQVVFCPDHPRAWSTGYVYTHVLIMERKLDRLLLAGEVVHHEDQDRLNNSPENLVLKTRSSHALGHAIRKEPLVMACAFCNREFRRNRTQRPSVKGYKDSYCSRRCNGLANGFKPL